MPQRTGLDAAFAPRMKARYIPIRAKQMLMRICSCSFLRRLLKLNVHSKLSRVHKSAISLWCITCLLYLRCLKQALGEVGFWPNHFFSYLTSMQTTYPFPNSYHHPMGQLFLELHKKSSIRILLITLFPVHSISVQFFTAMMPKMLPTACFCLAATQTSLNMESVMSPHLFPVVI